jgi:Amt family ammonium transporter
VAITSGCSVLQPWAALIAGGLAPFLVSYGEAIVEYIKVDDPAGHLAIHGLSGIWGILIVGKCGKGF